jgi:hypothetical protein
MFRVAEVVISPVLRTNNAHVVEHTLLSGRAAGPVQQLLVADHSCEFCRATK